MIFLNAIACVHPHKFTKRLIFVLILLTLSDFVCPSILNKKLFIQSDAKSYFILPEGLYLYDAESDKLRLERQGDFSDLLDDEGRLWLACEQGLLVYDLAYFTWKQYSPSQNFAAPIISIAADMDYVYAATNDKIYRFDKLSEEWKDISFKSAESIVDMEIVGGELWAATFSELFRFIIDSEQWEHYPAAIGGREVLRVINYDASAWVIQEGGAARFNPQFRKFEAYSSAQGFPQERISMAETDGVNLWILSGQRIFRYKKGANVFEPFYRRLGHGQSLFRD
ncbi:MAG: hypothetical protein AB1633_10720, partial [Elusimicrobiota bacterium]